MPSADLMKRLTTRYDNLFETSFPYTMGFHQRPTDGQTHEEWHFHAHYYPPFSGRRPFVSSWWDTKCFGTPQRDITPESAAERLREVSEIHYLDGDSIIRLARSVLPATSHNLRGR